MANNTFQLKRSSVAGKQPNTSTLAVGELAINLTDKKLYSSDGTNIFETGANLTTLTVSTNTSVNNVIITGGVYANGSYGSANQVLTTNGSSVYWSTVTGGGGGSSYMAAQQQYVANGSVSTFTVTGGYISNNLSVYLNGVLLRKGTEVDVTNGSTFTITPTPANGALIDAIGVSPLNANGFSTVISEQFTANGTANSFQITGGYLPNQVQVYVNGVKQVPGVDVILTSGNTVNLLVTPANGYSVDVFGIQSPITISSNTLNVGGVLNTNSLVITTGTITVNGSTGSANQVLTSNGTGVYWANAGGGFTNGQSIAVNNFVIAGAVQANSSNGSSGQILASNGTGVYWTNDLSSTAYSNATSYADTKAATAYSNAIAYSGNAAQAYSNATSYADTKAATAYSNAIAYSGNAAQAYSNAVTYVSAQAYVNTSQLSSNLSNYQTTAGLSANVATLAANAATYLNGKTEGNLNVNNALTANNSSYLGGSAANAYALLSGASFTGSVTITGNLTVSGNVTTIGANNLSIVDNMIYLNSNSTVTNPDLGFAGNYNDGSYKHTGFFRDATDGVWKVFDSYTPEPDASPYIDTTNTSFHIANFQANVIYVGNTSVYSTINTTSFTGTSNNSTYLNGQLASYYTNATNITTGTLPYAQIPANVINTTAAFTISGIHTYNANVVISNTSELVISSNAGIYANGSFGSNGQVLTSNASSVYWASVAPLGGGNDRVFYENDITVSSDYTITTNKNAMTAGPVTVNSGVTVTIPSGSVWTIV